MVEDYKTELDAAVRIAAEAADVIRQFYYNGAAQETKEDGTPVTEADIRANEIILSRLQEAFPTDGIVSEELETVVGGRTWYVDPIDGTKGFIYKNDHYAIHIGLVEDDVPVLGVVYKPTTDSYYFGIRGHGAYFVSPKGEHRKLNALDSPEEGIVLVSNTKFLYKQPGRSLVDRMLPKKTLVTGSQGLRIAKVAEGIANLHIFHGDESPLGTWDVCAPQAIAEAAGATLIYWNGNPITYHGQRRLDDFIIAARTPELAEWARGIVAEV